MRGFVILIAFLAALAGLASFGGRIHPAADTLALGRPVLLVVCLASVLAARALVLRVALGAVALVMTVSMAPAFLPQAPGGEIRIYVKNLWAGNRDVGPLAGDIRAAGVDAVLLQEVSDGNRGIMDLLRPDFPHQAFCRFSDWSGVAVLSKHRIDGEQVCTTGRAATAAPIRVGGRRVWIVSVHIPWLWPYRSADNEAAASRLLARLDGPVVLAGDFNAFPWTERVARTLRQTGTRLAGPVRPTFWYRGLPMALDFAMAPGGGSVEVRPLFGSDHGGLVADLALEAP